MHDIDDEEDAAPPSPVSGLPAARVARDDVRRGDVGSDEVHGDDAALGSARAASLREERESFADLAPDSSDRAPSAPLTPWNNVPQLAAAPASSQGDAGAHPAVERSGGRDSSPALAIHSSAPGAFDSIPADADDSLPPEPSWSAEASSPPIGIEPEDESEDKEDTIVGEVPQRLLEIAAVGDENTRAYTAPQELIELAKRKREERMRHQAASAEAHSRETERPPPRPVPLDSLREESFAGVMPEDGQRTPAPAQMRDHRESAPPIARPFSAALGESRPNEPSSPAGLRSASSSFERSDRRIDAAVRDSVPVGQPALRADESAPQSEAFPMSTFKTPWVGSPRRWLVLAGVCLALGILLSSWRAIEQLLR